MSFDELAVCPRWVAWQAEKRGEQTTKVPYAPRSGYKAKANDPSTWGFMSEAFDRYDQLPKLHGDGGIGIELGDLGDGRSIGGIDLDTCRDRDGNIEPWAQEIMTRFQSYTEVSPSGTGIKVFFLYDTSDLATLRAAMGTEWSRLFKRPGDNHPPGIELHLGNRYFTMTVDITDDSSGDLRYVSCDDLLWMINQVGPTFAGKSNATPPASVQRTAIAKTDIDQRIAGIAAKHPTLQRYLAGDFSTLSDQSRSTHAFALGAALKRAGLDFDEMCEVLRSHSATSSWVKEKGEASNQRQLRRIWDKVDVHEPSPNSEPAEPSPILERTTCEAPQLPVATFGPFWGDWIRQAAEGANAPVDYTALALLALSSTLIGNARWVQAWEGWKEPPVLWCCGVGDPSSGKTPGAAPVIREALAKVEVWMARDHQAVHDEWIERSASATAIRKVWERSVAEAVEQGKEPPPRPKGIDIGDEPTPPYARVGNITIEQMVNILARQPKGLLCANDELAQWFSNFERYSKGSDRPFWLESYNGGSFRLDRVSKADPVRIPHLSVGLFGTIQPERLAVILKGADDGLVSRFLFAWPEPIPFKRPGGHANVLSATEALCHLADLTMASDEAGSVVPSFIPLDDDATVTFETFARELADRERQAQGMMKGILGKARGQTLRLALTLEFLWWCGTTHAEPTSVHKRSVAGAIQLMDTYFLPMAVRALGDAVLPEDARDARTVARWVLETKPGIVNITAIRDQAHLEGLSDTKRVKAAVRYLAEAGWLEEAPRDDRPGRPRGDYLVNPKVWDMQGTSAA